MADPCACGAPAVAPCAACGAPICADHAVGPRRPRPRHFRFVAFSDLLRDFPVSAGIDAGQMWAVRADVARRHPPDDRCLACWEGELRAALARVNPEPLPAYDATSPESGAAVVSAADLLAAWSSAARPEPLPDGVGTSRFRAVKGWRLGPLEDERLVRDGEGSVRVQVAVAYLTRAGEVWIPGRRLDEATGFPVQWLPPVARPTPAASSSAPTPLPASARQQALDRARARALAVLQANGWPA